jgi:hypothetical protein
MFVLIILTQRIINKLFVFKYYESYYHIERLFKLKNEKQLTEEN